MRKKNTKWVCGEKTTGIYVPHWDDSSNTPCQCNKEHLWAHEDGDCWSVKCCVGDLSLYEHQRKNTRLNIKGNFWANQTKVKETKTKKRCHSIWKWVQFKGNLFHNKSHYYRQCLGGGWGRICGCCGETGVSNESFTVDKSKCALQNKEIKQKNQNSVLSSHSFSKTEEMKGWWAT